MATDFSFEKIKDIKQKYKDFAYGYIRECYGNVPTIIQSTVLLFYYVKLESEILTDEETKTLLSLFETHDKFVNPWFELLYSSKRDGIGHKNFNKKCEDESNLLCLIQNKTGNVFGGYTKTGWNSIKIGPQTDENAFIFSIRSNENYPPAIFNPIISKNALYHQPDYYCIFGSNCAFYVQPNGMAGGCNAQYCSSYEQYAKEWYLTGRARFYVESVEVFKLKSLQ